MLFSEEKSLVAWNKEVLDTYHDIVVSFDYTRYAIPSVPQGGFCVVFFEDENEVPVVGGPEYNLGYTPSNKSDYCYIRGYSGFKNGYLGVGFDLPGRFGEKTDLVDGLEVPIPNSCSIRGSETDKYKLLATSKNLLYTQSPFLIASQIKAPENKKYNTVRVIISKAFTDIEVQVKKEEDKSFFTVLKAKLPIKRQTGVKVGITNTLLDNYTKFELKNFNVAGFPGAVAPPLLENCAETYSYATVQGKTIVSGKNFAAVPVDGGVNVYDIRNGSLNRIQSIQESDKAYLLGGNDNFLILNKSSTYDLDIYYRANSRFIKTQTISLTGDVDNVPLSEIGGFPECADVDDKTLAVGNKKGVYLWQFFPGTAAYGTFSYIQAITNSISGDIGYSVQVDGDKLLTGGGKPRLSGRYNSFVAYYKNNGLDWNIEPEQIFTSPISGNPYDEFGYTLRLQGNEAIIGSPNEGRRGLNTVGHGEAYHYVFSLNRQKGKREWRPVMGLGNYFLIDSPGGNFGTALDFIGNNLIISAPYENYLFPPDLIFENKPNCGRVYVFRKNRGGTFSQAAILAPDPFRAREYLLFGRYVGYCGNNTAIVGVPYNDNILFNAEVDAYKYNCIFELPPAHLPINLNSIALYDSAGYVIDMKSFTYMQLITRLV